jgi:hypothetical protein
VPFLPGRQKSGLEKRQVEYVLLHKKFLPTTVPTIVPMIAPAAKSENQWIVVETPTPM